MNRVSLLALIGACAMSLGIGQGALADDTKGEHEPTAQELKNSKDRGIFLKVPGSPAAFELQKANPTQGSTTTTTTKETTKPAAKPAEQPKAAPATVKTTVKEQSIKTTTTKETPAKPATEKKTTTKTDKTSQSLPGKRGGTALKTVVKPATKATPAVKTVAKADTNAGHGSAVATSDSGETVISAWLNKSGKRPCYKDGDKLEVSVKANKDCNLVIYDFDGRGTLTQIFPNEYQKECAVKSGETITIGGANSNFDFEVSLAEGTKNQQERLFIFAYPTKDEAPVSVAMAKVQDSPFRSAQMSLEQYRNLVNQSKVYFARSVSVKAKRSPVSSIATVSNEINNGDVAPNKMELSFSVVK